MIKCHIKYPVAILSSSPSSSVVPCIRSRNKRQLGPGLARLGGEEEVRGERRDEDGLAEGHGGVVLADAARGGEGEVCAREVVAGDGGGDVEADCVEEG